MALRTAYSCFFFFNDTATTEIYTLSLHDALPICVHASILVRDPVGLVDVLGLLSGRDAEQPVRRVDLPAMLGVVDRQDRKSTRLNSSHANISYAVFCLKKKKTTFSI